MRSTLPRLSIFSALFLPTIVNAYIPAMPSNDTTLLPTTDNADSSLLLRWTDQGNYGEGISRVLENENGSSGIEKVGIRTERPFRHTPSNERWRLRDSSL